MTDTIEFQRYDNGKRASYTLGHDESFRDVKCPFDGTPIVANCEYDDFFCPNCRTNYDYADSQKNMDKQRKRVFKSLRTKLREAKEIQEKYNHLVKLISS